jgi:hypothetical protein
VGIIIEHMSMVEDMTGFDNLKALAKINNIVSDDEIIEIENGKIVKNS